MVHKYKKPIKIVLCVLLIFACIGGIIGIKNYKTTGTFTIAKRNLPIYCVDTDEKKIAITFDASWGEDRTDSILEILDKYNIKASFFLVGGWIDKYPDKVKAMYERGHELGNHSNTHPDMTKISREKIINEIAVTDAKIMGITGERTKLFRFPSGAYNDMAIETVNNTKHQCIQWDADSIDWKERGADIEYDRVVKNAKKGSIILFHNNAKFTPKNLPRIIEKLKSEGYEFVKVSEIVYKDDYIIDHTGKQTKK